MLYCENCMTIFDGDHCPDCKATTLRSPEPSDFCFLVEKEVMWGEMLADILKQQQIPFTYKPILGAGLALKVGPAAEQYRFFVPYSHYQQAQEIVEQIFG